MCRRNLFFAGVVIAFGVGLLFGIFFESAVIQFVLGIGSIMGGLFLLHK